MFRLHNQSEFFIMFYCYLLKHKKQTNSAVIGRWEERDGYLLKLRGTSALVPGAPPALFTKDKGSDLTLVPAMFHFRPADGNNRLQKQSFLTAKLLRTLIEKDR